MARRTWKDMRDEAVSELRARDDIVARTEAWLREAYLEVAYSYRFYELEKSASFDLGVNASEVDFETAEILDVKHIFSLRDQTSGRRVNPASFRYIDRLSIGSGVPTLYCRFGNSILFNAIPSGSNIRYKLRYRKQVAEPNYSGAASPETPTEWDEVIRLKAVARGFHALLEPDISADKRNICNELISALPIDEFVEAEDSNFGITPRSE